MNVTYMNLSSLLYIYIYIIYYYSMHGLCYYLQVLLCILYTSI